MVFTVDLPDALVERIDAHVTRRPRRPAWPFTTRYVVRQQLSQEELKLLEDYQEQDRIWKEKMKHLGPTSRSAFARAVFTEFLAKPSELQESESHA